MIAVVLTGGLANAGAASEAGVIALMGLGMLAAGALRVSTWARRRRAQFEDVIARLAGSARTPP